MKKKISLLLCLVMAMLVFSGCSKKGNTVVYDEATITQMTNFLIEYCNSVDDATVEQWENMSDLEQEMQFLQAGFRFTPDSFLGAIESWKAGVEECGEFVSCGDYSFEASADSLVVSVPATFAERDAEVTFTFDDKLYLESTTVNAKYTLPEILKKAGINTLLGMGTVFAVLILISFIISLFKYIGKIENRTKQSADAGQAAPVQVAATPAPAVEEVQDDLELIAVISAAIAAAEGTGTDGFVVRSIRRRPSNKWKA